MTQGSSLDTCFFEELEPVDGPAYDFLSEMVWGIIQPLFTNPNTREKAYACAMSIHHLFCQPVYQDEAQRRSMDHYRTRTEMMKSGLFDPVAFKTINIKPLTIQKVINELILSEYIELHPKWPRQLKDHPQAPYRPIVSHWWGH